MKFPDLLSVIAIWWLLIFAMVAAIEFISSVGSHLQEWLRAHRNINTEVPALSASVKELRTRQSRLEAELEQSRRIPEPGITNN